MKRFAKRLMLVTAATLFSFACTAASQSNPNATKTAPACAQVGESAGGSCLGCKTCCAGLVATNSWLQQNFETLGCSTPLPPASGGSCVTCGDGKCDSKNFENRCNCPKDCS